MDRGRTIIMFFLSYITDYPLLNALWATMVPAYGFQEQTLPINNQTKWWTQQDQRSKQANISIELTKTQHDYKFHGIQDAIRRETELPLWQSGAQKQTKRNKNEGGVEKQAEVPLSHAVAQKQSEHYGNKAKLHLWQTRTSKQANLHAGYVDVWKQADRPFDLTGSQMQTKLHSGQAGARNQKNKKKNLSLSATTTKSTRTYNGLLKVETILSNITDQRKQFKKDPSQSRGQINQNQEFQNQLHPYLVGGQMTPIKYQRDPTQIRTQMNPMYLQNNPSEWGRQEGSMQFQNKLEITNKKLQFDRGFIQTGGQRTPRQFQGNPSQVRDQMTRNDNMQHKTDILQIGRQNDLKQFRGQSEIINKNFQNQWGTTQFGQMAAMQFHREPSQMRQKMYPTPIMQHRMGSTHRGLNKMYFQNQNNAQTGRQIIPKQLNYSNKFFWGGWIPPHLINDEYYYETPAPKDTGISKDGKGKGGSGKGQGGSGKSSDGSYGDFAYLYHPNHPRFAFNATLPQRHTTTPTTIKTGTNDCDHIKDGCMRAHLTGSICARTAFFTYLTYPNYCLMDYVNCVEQVEVWSILHMGKCYQAAPLEKYNHYAYASDGFMDEIMARVD